MVQGTQLRHAEPLQSAQALVVLELGRMGMAADEVVHPLLLKRSTAPRDIAAFAPHWHVQSMGALATPLRAPKKGALAHACACVTPDMLRHAGRALQMEATLEDLNGKIAWVTGAGSGIGEAAANALAAEGMTLVLTGRREKPLSHVAQRIKSAGGKAVVQVADLTAAPSVHKVAEGIGKMHGHLDVLVNNAGTNIPDRSWQKLKPEGIDTLIQGNLTSAFYVVQAVLPIMRAQRGGLMIHTASWAGRFVGPVAGPAYIAAKHGMVAMSHSINLEECMNGIRSSVICPGEVATPIMALRSPPEAPEALARMIQPEDMGSLIAFIAKQPRHVCINEVLISPSHNRGYIGVMKARQAPA